MPKPETKFWHELKRITPQITWTRLENTSVLGCPDLLGYNNNQHFFTVELKVAKGDKVKFSPHQIAFHVRHPKNTFILASAQAPSSVKLYPGSMILELRGELAGGSHPAAVGLDACGLVLGSLGEKSLRAGPTRDSWTMVSACGRVPPEEKKKKEDRVDPGWTTMKFVNGKIIKNKHKIRQ